MWRSIDLFRRDFLADLLNSRITVEDLYRSLYITVILVTTVILGISLAVDVAGINGLNIVLIPVWVIIVGYFGFHPTYITLALATGGAATLGRDADRQRIIDGIKAASGKWKEFFLHLAMFGAVFFLTRFLVPVKAYPFMGMLLLGGLMSLGLWSWIYAGGKWYKWCTLGIALIAVAISLFGSFAGRPATPGHPGAPMTQGIAGVVEGFTWSKTLELEMDQVKNYTLCGIHPGSRKFSIPDKQYIFMDGDNVEMTSFIRVNGTLPNETFQVDDKGCAQVTLAFTSRATGRMITPQIIRIAFR